jgi:hypothetical protein
MFAKFHYVIRATQITGSWKISIGFATAESGSNVHIREIFAVVVKHWPDLGSEPKGL